MEPNHQGWPPPQPPYGTPQQPPYGPPFPPYGTPPRPPLNGLSVASLVLGLVCCLPPLGLVLGIVALVQIKRRGQRGRGMAVAGVVLSSVGTLLLGLFLISGAASDFWGGFRDAVDQGPGNRSVTDLRKGDCYKMSGGLAEREVDRVSVVDCAERHDGEVTGSFPLEGYDAWPGRQRIEQVAEERCEKLNGGYAMDTWAVPEDAWTYYYLPSRTSWRLGDHKVTCSMASEKGDLKGSLRADSTTLDAQQAAYLKAVNRVDAVLGEQPDEDADEDLAGAKAWAGKVTAALETSAGELRGVPWSAAAKKPATDVAGQLERARAHWARAQGAADADAYWDAYDPGFDALPPDLGAAARKALGLRTEPQGGSSTQEPGTRPGGSPPAGRKEV
ncbi:DUF4190 domain-containing protein [Streptomyces sp. NPDC001941]|uniref:DUF4190 domain-containing protein n=1 Tax=Streptomyces sp. NPDC001941 TaxID=3154659 RepID=UPI00332E4012